MVETVVHYSSEKIRKNYRIYQKGILKPFMGGILTCFQAVFVYLECYYVKSILDYQATV